MKPLKNVDEALNLIKPGTSVMLHSACAEPQTLVERLVQGIKTGQPNLQNLTIYALTYRHSVPPYADLELLQSGKLKLKSFFPHSVMREVAQAGLVDYIPVSFSGLPGLLTGGYIKIEAAFLQLALPDENGLCSVGPSADCVEAILETTPTLIGEINRQMPQTFGLRLEPNQFAALIESNRPLVEVPSSPIGALERQIATYVMEFIADGATVQLGVGTTPEAVAELLTTRRDISLHSGAITDATIALLESGAITNSRSIVPGVTIASLLLGTRRLFDYAHQNPAIEVRSLDFINSPRTTTQLNQLVSVNSALEVDYWGQVNAEAVGNWQLAGVGGQLDYIQGAWASGGVSIIALPSVTGSGRPRIVPRLSAGTPVTTPRHLAQVVITENGIADLRGRSLSEREKLLKQLLA